jgi:hypothetical protein
MSNPIKLALLAMVLVPVLATWLFWGRHPTGVVAAQPPVLPSPPAPVAASVPETPSAEPAPIAPSPPALTTIRGPIVTLEPAPSAIVGDSEVRARMMLRHRPALLKGMPAGCDPPFFTDSDGNKRFKSECF